MGGFGSKSRLGIYLRLFWLSAGCVVLANCAKGNTASRVDPNSISITTATEAGQEQDRIIRDADRAAVRYVPDISSGHPIVVGARPRECPRTFCGCEASLYLFGQVRPELNLASNWRRQFPRTSPAPGMAAVRNHHVFVLMNQVSGSNWLVHDGNSGHGLIREHVRSISGYIVVNPKGTDTPAPSLAQAE
jgi:hypothetical protein